MTSWKLVAEKMSKSLTFSERKEIEIDKYSTIALLREAHRDLEAAHKLMDQVVEQDMIEYAVYNLKAAEKRCDYLIKAIKEEKNEKNKKLIKPQN